MYFGHEDGFPGASRRGRNLRRTLDVIGREKKRGTAIAGAQAKSRKVVGVGCIFSRSGAVETYYDGKNQQDGKNRKLCVIWKASPSLCLFLFVSLPLSLRNEAVGWKNDPLSSLTVAFHRLNVNTAGDPPPDRAVCSISETRSLQELMGQSRKHAHAYNNNAVFIYLNLKVRIPGSYIKYKKGDSDFPHGPSLKMKVGGVRCWVNIQFAVFVHFKDTVVTHQRMLVFVFHYEDLRVLPKRD